MTMTAASPAQRALVSTWLLAGLVTAGIAWAAGIDLAWWQRALAVLPLAVAAVADHHAIPTAVDVRHAAGRVLGELGWLQLPLAVAGGAWAAGILPDAPTRITLAVLVVLVAALVRYAPAAPAATGGAR